MTCIKYCSANFCKNNSRTNPNLRYHKFPFKSEIRRKWNDFCEKTKKQDVIKTGFLCSKHFTEEDYVTIKIALTTHETRKCTLKRDALPSVRCELFEDEEYLEGGESVMEEPDEVYLFEEFLEEDEIDTKSGKDYTKENPFPEKQEKPASGNQTEILSKIDEIRRQILKLQQELDSKSKELDDLVAKLDPNTSNTTIPEETQVQMDGSDELKVDEENLHQFDTEMEFQDDSEEMEDSEIESPAFETVEKNYESLSFKEDSFIKSDTLEILSHITDLENVNELVLSGKVEPETEAESCDQEVILAPRKVETVERKEALIIVPPNPSMILYPPNTTKNSNPQAILEILTNIECPTCFKLFHKDHYQKHLQTHPREDGFFYCEQSDCNKKFTTLAILRRHQSIHIADPKTCTICGKTCRNGKDLSKHMWLHNKEKNHACDICDKSFKLKIHLKNHVRVHSDERPFQCQYCSASFRQSYSLTLHERGHQGISYQCNECQSEFHNLSALSKHKMQCDGNYKQPKKRKNWTDWRSSEDEKIQCFMQKCLYYCKSEVTMNKHLLTVHKIEAVNTECNVCGMKMVTSEAWIEHMNWHRKESIRQNVKKFQCEFCRCHFVEEEKLNSHVLKLHTKSPDRPYECELCQSYYKKPEHLKIHNSWRHSDNRPFQCDICEAKFPKKSDLNSHMKKHSDDRKYKCRICGSSSKSSSNLRKHLEKSHDTTDVYECTDCLKLFKYYDDFRDHLKTHDADLFASEN